MILSLALKHPNESILKYIASSMGVEVMVDKHLKIDEPSLVISSEPLQSILRMTLQVSHNLYSELLLRKLSTLGVTQDIYCVPAILKLRLNMKSTFNWNQADGSGLSYHNLVSPMTIVELLQNVYMVGGRELGDLFVSLLPICGKNGTLASRLQNISGSVYAKSGSLRFVTALSGYVLNSSLASDDYIVFSILVNNVLDPSKGRKAIDEICSLLALKTF